MAPDNPEWPQDSDGYANRAYIPMVGVREHQEELPVSLTERNGRQVVYAQNEGGHNCTEVDLLDLIAWLRANKPEVLEAR